MAQVDETWRMTPMNRKEVARFLGVADGDSPAVAEVEEVCRLVKAIRRDMKAAGRPKPKALAEVREQSQKLLDALRALDPDTADHLEERWRGVMIRETVPPVRGMPPMPYRDVQQVVMRLRDAAAPHETRGAPTKEWDVVLASWLADVWEKYTGEAPEWKVREGAGAFQMFADFIATDAMELRRQDGIERAVKFVLTHRGRNKERGTDAT